MTHNFDFYRTIYSRLDPHPLVFMATKTDDGRIEMKKGQYLYDVFSKVLSEHIDQGKDFVSMIPFVRNIIEYTKGTDSDEYCQLTACLHMKKRTKDLKVADVLTIFQGNISKCNGVDRVAFKDKHIIDLIYGEAQELIKTKNIDEIELANKFVVSIAIRLKTETFLITQLGVDTDSIHSNQTSNLVRQYKQKYPEKKDVIHILNRVNLMTPENIHVNTFMYEPLIDMSVNHLIKLYQDVEEYLI